MGTFTAQILVGHVHQNHGGIIPTHSMYLSENSRPAWLIKEIDLWDEGIEKLKEVIWIPTIENMMEDALLMVGLFILKDGKLLDAANKFFKKDINGRVELYEDIEADDLSRLYHMCRELKNHYKIAITTFGSSSIDRKLKVLEKYNMDVDICKPIYSRTFSEWSQKTIIEGKL